MTDAPPPPGQPYQPPQQQPLSPQDEKTYSTLMHVGGILFGFIPSLVVYLMFKDRGPFIRQHSQTALNFQLTMTIAAIASYILMLVLIGFITIFAVAIVVVVFSIIAAMKANQGEVYTYPLSIKFFK
jgi:uncharacterized protein